jgi:hypothetical protein
LNDVHLAKKMFIVLTVNKKIKRTNTTWIGGCWGGGRTKRRGGTCHDVDGALPINCRARALDCLARPGPAGILNLASISSFPFSSNVAAVSCCSPTNLTPRACFCLTPRLSSPTFLPGPVFWRVLRGGGGWRRPFAQGLVELAWWCFDQCTLVIVRCVQLLAQYCRTR